jgi:hypothetical protein
MQSKKHDHFAMEWTTAQRDIERRGKRDEIRAYSLGTAGAASVIAGAVLMWLGRDQRELVIEPVPIGAGAAATWTQRF